MRKVRKKGGWLAATLAGTGIAALAGMLLSAAPASAAGATPDPVLWTSSSDGTALHAQVVNQAGAVVGTDSLALSSLDTKVVGDSVPNGMNLLSSVLYHSTSGVLQPVGVVNHKILMGATTLSWTCPSACAAVWKLVGYEDYNGDGYLDPLWYDAADERLAAWLTGPGLAVTGTKDLPVSCHLCGNTRVVASADFNSDGAPDVLSYNADSGNLTITLLNRTGGLVGQQYVSWTCGSSGGCATDWKFVGVGDYNGDGRPDLLWNDPWTGQVGYWQLDGAGNVVTSHMLSTNTPAWATIAGTTMALDPAF
jgi:hypothetical protein